MAAREQCASRARSLEWEGLLGLIVGASPGRRNVFNSHPSILCQGSNKPQKRRMNFCSKRKDSALGGCCHHIGSDILVSCYWLILSMFHASPTTSRGRLLPAIQRESQDRHEHITKIHNIFEESPNYESEAPKFNKWIKLIPGNWAN